MRNCAHIFETFGLKRLSGDQTFGLLTSERFLDQDGQQAGKFSGEMVGVLSEASQKSRSKIGASESDHEKLV